MSRYTFPGNTPGLVIVAGWDNPLETYFAQVWDGGEPEAGDLLLWLGGERGEVVTISALVDHLAPYAEIPEETLTSLRDDWNYRGPAMPLLRLFAK